MQILFEEETICMNCHSRLSGNNKKIIKLSSAESDQEAVKVNNSIDCNWYFGLRFNA